MKRLRRWVIGLLCALVALRIAVALWPRPPLSERFPSSVAVYDAHQRLMRLTLASDDTYRLWTPLEKISPELVQATLLYEDKHFFSHPGVNPASLVRAALATYGSGGRRIGGSTLTMQLARKLYGISSRSVGGKLEQIARATQLELLYSKHDLLEAYLNLAPYGRNIEGAGAASQIYFGKPVDKLLLPEALALAVIPKSPARRTPDVEGKNPHLAAARLALFRRFSLEHPAARRDEALFAAPIPVREASALPFLAPHFVEAILGERPAPRTITTLDLGLQQLVERHARAYVARKKRFGIENAAALLVDTRTMDIKAELGSIDFWNAGISGQVNGAQAKRSPGSTLKPLVYALGLEQGVIHPQTMLKDSPLSFGPFSPENFDGRFLGPLSATDALCRSRNIPALGIAAKLSRPSLHELLRTAGITRLRSEEHYGLSVALGGAEVTMEELVGLYAALANHGVMRPLRNVARNDGPGVRILSEEAAFLVLDMLKSNPRPDRAHGPGLGQDALPVAWKTGTSYGFRDAWTVGVFGPYVLAVWIGNFSGEGNPAFVGIEAAAPLFFEIVDSIRARERLVATPQPAPASLTRVSVCGVSGRMPGPSCPTKRTTWFIPGRSPIDVCDIHREVLVDDRTGRQSCGTPTGPTHREVFEFWPSDLLKLFQAAGIPRRSPPALGPGCDLEASAQRGASPRITSPLLGVTYTVRTSKPTEGRIALAAVTDADAREVFWFLGERLIGKSPPGGQLLFLPSAGAHTVRAVDDHGRSDARLLNVEVIP